MNKFPAPVIVAALAAIVAAPVSAVAAGTLLFTASFGLIIHADYVQRHRRIRLPRLAATRRNSNTRPPFRAEANRLAA